MRNTFSQTFPHATNLFVIFVEFFFQSWLREKLVRNVRDVFRRRVNFLLTSRQRCTWVLLCVFSYRAVCKTTATFLHVHARGNNNFLLLFKTFKTDAKILATTFAGFFNATFGARFGAETFYAVRPAASCAPPHLQQRQKTGCRVHAYHRYHIQPTRSDACTCAFHART